MGRMSSMRSVMATSRYIIIWKNIFEGNIKKYTFMDCFGGRPHELPGLSKVINIDSTLNYFEF